MKKSFRHSAGLILAIAVLLFAFTACKKEKSKGTRDGSNTIAYESDYMYGYKFSPSQYGNTFIVFYDIDVYSDILGRIAWEASGSKTNGKNDWFKDINVKNINLSTYSKLNLSGSDLNFNHDLINCKLIYSYYPIDNSGKKEQILATFGGYNSAKNEVELIPNGGNLLSLFKSNPYGRLLLEFSFSKSSAIDSYANLGYNIFFDYDYSYTMMEAKE